MNKLNKLKTLLLAGLFTVLSAEVAQAATYTVQSGDSLYSIGRTYNTSYQSLMSANNLSSSIIKPGQVLTIPTYYTVKSGDTLYSISRRYGVTVDALRRANNEWDSIIYVGQRLRIPSQTVSTQSSPSVIPYTASELDLLARLVRAEAENQTYAAKVAVAAVVVNRVQSDKFPNTISSVIYQVSNGYYQFTPVQNGYINKTASQEDINAAYAALHGSDPTNGALFYFDDSTTSQWLWSRPITYRNGDMVYTY